MRGATQGVLIGALLLCLLIGGCAGCRSAFTGHKTITVTRLDDQAKRHGHQYLVFAREGVYKDTDNILFLKYNSSDLFNKLQVGHTYNCKTFGIRLPLFSHYPNLISCEEVKAAVR